MKGSNQRIYDLTFASIYPLYRAKIQRKSQNLVYLDQVITWLTGYDQASIQKLADSQVSFEQFFNQAPKLNPKRKLITGSICGIKLNQIDDSIVQNVRYLDKLVDEIAKGRAIEKILR